MAFMAPMALAAILTVACSRPTAMVPETFEEAGRPASIFPDYTNVVIPPNIAPLNFMLKDTALTAVVASFQGKGDPLVVGARMPRWRLTPRAGARSCRRTGEATSA